MATVAAPYGAKPVGSVAGVYNGKLRQIRITSTYATSIFFGDFISMAASGTVEKVSATNAGPIIGVFMGCNYTDPNSGQRVFRQYWPASIASVDNYAYVADDADMLFQIQSAATIAQADLGQNAPIIQTAGTTIVGVSKNALDGANKNSTATLPLKIIGFVNGPFSAPGDAKTDVLVMINTHQYRSTGVAGI